MCMLLYGTAFAQKPGGIGSSAGMTVWLKANTTVSGNITTSATIASVSAWKSELGNVTLSQGTASRQPVYQSTNTPAGNFNFNPFIQFIQTNTSYLFTSSTSPDLLGTAGTIFMVVNTYGGRGPTGLTYMASSSYRYQVKPGFRMQTGSGGLGYTADYYETLVPYTAPLPNSYIITSRGNGSVYGGRKNGTAVPLTNNADGTYNPAVNSGFYIGGNATSEPFNGGMAEVITYNTTLSNADVNKVESYLALKYGVTLINSNYTAADGTTFWDTTGKGAFINNITGIGRDDSSALLQKQSKSVHDSSLIYIYNGSAGAIFPDANASNSAAISSDKSFLLAGDNGLTKKLQGCVGGSNAMLMPRIWRVQKTGSGIGQVIIAVDTAGIESSITRLIISSGPGFASGATSSYQLITTGSKRYVMLTLNTNDYFTFATDSLKTPVAVADSTCPGGTSKLTVQAPNSLYSYYWYAGTTGGSKLDSGTVYTTPAVTPPATYYVGSAYIGCASNRSAVTIYQYAPLPSPVVAVTTGTTENSINFAWQAVPGATGYQVSVDGGAYTAPSSGSTGTSHTITGLSPLQTVTLSVFAQGLQSCKNSAATKTTGKTMGTNIYIPNAFSPNGDGKNDVFKIYSNIVAHQEIRIFSQWGELIYQTSNMGEGWDGTAKGKSQPAGVYIYAIRLKLTDGTEVVRKGSFNLLH